MFRPLAVFIGLRYTRAKRRNHFISFISLMSIMGIALGVLVLITVLSVMNGFDREIKKRVFSLVPPITVSSIASKVINWQEAETILKKNPVVMNVAPFVSGQVLLTNDNVVQPAMLNGILPDEEKKMNALSDKMVQGKLTDLRPGQFDIVLGEDLANRLNAVVGDKITVMVPEVSVTPAGVVPRFKRFTVVGIFRVGGGFGFDTSLGFLQLSDAQRLLQLGKAVTGLHVNVKNVYTAPKIAKEMSAQLGSNAYVTDWTDTFGPLFFSISMEKKMMFFILMLIIAVAVFNLVSTLVMVVNEKTADIAILRTYGATPSMILSIFVVQGAVIGIVGTLAGVVGGVALALNVTRLVAWIERVFHIQFISANVYFVDYLPSQLLWGDVWRIGLAALILSLLATIYPAWRASCTEPVEALRYE